MQINIRQLESFFAVAEELHFGRAAERLHLSPARVSDAVATLERRLSLRLFTRTTRRVSLTEHGQWFLERAQGPFAELQRLHDEARLRSGLGEVVVAYTPDLGHLLVPGLLVSGDEDQPRSTPPWKPTVMHTADQLRALEAGTIDLGLCWSPPTLEFLSSTPLAEVAMVAVLRKDDQFASREGVRLRDLGGRPILLTPRGVNPVIDAEIQSDLAAAGIPSAQVTEVPRTDEMALQVAAGRGVGLHPGTIAITSPVPGLVYRPIIDPTRTVRISAIQRSDVVHPDVPLVLESLRKVVEGLGLTLDMDVLTPDAD